MGPSRKSSVIGSECEPSANFKLDTEEKLHSEIDLGIYSIDSNWQNDTLNKDSYKTNSICLITGHREDDMRKLVSNWLPSIENVKDMFNEQNNVITETVMNKIQLQRNNDNKINKGTGETQYEHNGKRSAKCIQSSDYIKDAKIKNGLLGLSINKHIYEQTRSDKQVGRSYCTEGSFKDSYKLHLYNENQFHCSYCTMSFRSMFMMQRHEMTHTEQKPFFCSVCKRSFASSSAKIVHERTHTGEKPFACVYCKKNFNTKHNKITHERIHTGEKPFPCSYCKKGFRTGSQKVRHERIHTGEKPFPCSYCKKSFSTSDWKMRHEMIHSNSQPFACSYCKKCFRRRDGLIKHERTHTK